MRSTHILPFLLLLATLHANAQDQCKDILVAAYNKFHLESTQSASSASKEWFCSDHFLSDIDNSSAGGSVVIPIDGIPVQFNGSKSSASALLQRDRFCKSSSSYFSSDQALSIFSQVVEKSTIKAWETCMRDKNRNQSNSSITLTDRVVGDDIFITASFRIVDDKLRDVRPTLITYYYTNAEVKNGEWTTGKEIPVGGVLQQFKRINRNQPVTVLISTSIGQSDILEINPVEYPDIVGDLTVSWEEKYQTEGEPEELWANRNTGDHHCSHDCRGEPTRTAYDVRLEPTETGTGRILTSSDGYLSNPRLDCIAGPCPWSQKKEVKLINSTTAYASFDVWAGPMTWRLSATWRWYTTGWKEKSTTKRPLKRGDYFTITVPTDARSVKFFGHTEEGDFEYTFSSVRSSTWLKYKGYKTVGAYDQITFQVPTVPE